MAYAVQFTQSARRDLEAIVAYIARESGQAIAMKILGAIEKRCADLSEMPERGNIPKELAARNDRRYRELHYKPYRILYRVSGKVVTIHCVADGRRNMVEFLRQRLSGLR